MSFVSDNSVRSSLAVTPFGSEGGVVGSSKALPLEGVCGAAVGNTLAASAYVFDGDTDAVDMEVGADCGVAIAPSAVLASGGEILSGTTCPSGDAPAWCMSKWALASLSQQHLR
jgi:hypothetical protein